MNIVVCGNIKDEAVQLHKQIERQILDPETTKQERNKLEDAKLSMAGAARLLLQAIAVKVEREMSEKEV